MKKAAANVSTGSERCPSDDALIAIEAGTAVAPEADGIASPVLLIIASRVAGGIPLPRIAGALVVVVVPRGDVGVETRGLVVVVVSSGATGISGLLFFSLSLGCVVVVVGFCALVVLVVVVGSGGSVVVVAGGTSNVASMMTLSMSQ